MKRLASLVFALACLLALTAPVSACPVSAGIALARSFVTPFVPTVAVTPFVSQTVVAPAFQTAQVLTVNPAALSVAQFSQIETDLATLSDAQILQTYGVSRDVLANRFASARGIRSGARGARATARAGARGGRAVARGGRTASRGARASRGRR